MLESARSMMSLARRVIAEAVGTAFLLAIVIGSGIMGERLSGGNTAIALSVFRRVRDEIRQQLKEFVL